MRTRRAGFIASASPTSLKERLHEVVVTFKKRGHRKVSQKQVARPVSHSSSFIFGNRCHLTHCVRDSCWRVGRTVNTHLRSLHQVERLSGDATHHRSSTSEIALYFGWNRQRRERSAFQSH